MPIEVAKAAYEGLLAAKQGVGGTEANFRSVSGVKITVHLTIS